LTLQAPGLERKKMVRQEFIIAKNGFRGRRGEGALKISWLTWLVALWGLALDNFLKLPDIPLILDINHRNNN
jgi:hypothetical protein